MKVYTCIIGDLFHHGHVSLLRQAKAEGDHLLVGVCGDEDCEKYKRKPVMTLRERVAVIEACRFVDEIIECPPSIITDAFMEKHHIDLVVHGDDSNAEQLKYFYSAAILKNKYKSLCYTSDISTTEIIHRIIRRSSTDLTRKHFLA